MMSVSVYACFISIGFYDSIRLYFIRSIHILKVPRPFYLKDFLNPGTSALRVIGIDF